jgi:hypothetical protein
MVQKVLTTQRTRKISTRLIIPNPVILPACSSSFFHPTRLWNRSRSAWPKYCCDLAVRDFGDIRLHVPTIRQHGVQLDSVPSGSATLTHNLHGVWSKVHHAMLQSHVGFLLSSMGLENEGRWSIVRELPAVLRPARSSLAQSLYDFFLADTMPFKVFLRCGWRGSVVM